MAEFDLRKLGEYREHNQLEAKKAKGGFPTIEETHRDGVDCTVLTLSTGGKEQDIKAMLELYSDLIDTIESQSGTQSDHKTTPSDQETNQMLSQSDQKIDQQQALTDQEGDKAISSDQELTSGDQIKDQKTKILNLIKYNPKITRLEISKAMSLHDSSVKRRLEGIISEGFIRRVGSTKAGHWEVL